jgi:hypothetical protein
MIESGDSLSLGLETSAHSWRIEQMREDHLESDDAISGDVALRGKRHPYLRVRSLR